MLHIFMDTMIYLHYKPVHEMNFKELFGVDEVTLQVPRITIRELDGHKDSHGSNRIRDKSRSTLQMFEKAIMGAGIVKPGVYLKHCQINPSETIAAYDLDATWNDDRLVASVLDFSNAVPGEKVILITQDTGAKLTCAQLGVEYASLPESYKLPPELDEHEREIKRLRSQVQRLETALPRIKFGFGSSQEEVLYVSISDADGESIENEISEKISALKIDVPEIDKPSRQASVANLSPLMRAGILGTPSDEEYERYDRERRIYFDKYELFMRNGFKRSRRLALSFKFDLSINNMGTCPADDVGVWIHFPDGFVLCEVADLEGEIGEEAVEPSPPPRPRSTLEMISNNSYFGAPGVSHFLSDKFHDFGGLSSPPRATVKRTNSYEVERDFTRVKHGVCESVATLVVLFESIEQVKSFSVEYRITVGNLPEAVVGGA